MEIELHADEVARINRRYARASQIARKSLARGMTAVTTAIQTDARQLVRKDTHRLERSIGREVTSAGPVITGRVGTDEPHAEPNEYGRRAGAPMPPKGVLLGWMSRHGIGAEFEFVVRRAIARRGIAPHPFLRPAYEQNRDLISKELGDKVVADITKGLANE